MSIDFNLIIIDIGGVNIEKELTGGHPNSLGNTEKVVAHVLEDKSRMQDLYKTYQSGDEVVRLRVSSCFKRVTKAKPEWMMEYLDRFILEVSKIDQASAQWTVAQIFELLYARMDSDQVKSATKALKRNLLATNDWIAIIQTQVTLAGWAKDNNKLKEWLVPILTKNSNDSRKSVASKSKKILAALS